MCKGEKSAMLHTEMRAMAFRAHSLRRIATTLADIATASDRKAVGGGVCGGTVVQGRGPSSK